MPDGSQQLTLALLLTAGGAVAAAGFITGIVQVVKAALPVVVSRDWEYRVALILTALLVIAAYAAGMQAGTLTLTFETVFAGVLAWYGIARLAKAFYDDATGAPGSLREPAPSTPPPLLPTATSGTTTSAGR